ncbi:MAG: NRDE family protein [Candidatus Rariloculaceae bacterium]
MCLVAFSLQEHSPVGLVFAANRDELHLRATADAGWWEDNRDIYGGRDLVAGGSWLAVDRSGRLAAVTNFREDPRTEYSQSRGRLVGDYLSDSVTATDFLAALEPSKNDYGPFNLILFDGRELHYASNRAATQRLAQGVHALSNAELGAPWPKVRHAAATLEVCREHAEPAECLFCMLTDRSLHGDVAPDADRATELRSTIYVTDEHYGTRCSTVVMLSPEGELQFTERRFAANGAPRGESIENFRING